MAGDPRARALGPTFVSVTYGAGGSTRDRTVRVTERIATETTLTPVGAPHLRRVVASPSCARWSASTPAPACATSSRCAATRPAGWARRGSSTPTACATRTSWSGWSRELGDFCVGVAAFPRAAPGVGRPRRGRARAGRQGRRRRRLRDHAVLLRRRRLLPAAWTGCARSAATMPIMPGIMPVTNVRQIERFAQLSGAPVPADAGRAAARGRGRPGRRTRHRRRGRQRARAGGCSTGARRGCTSTRSTGRRRRARSTSCWACAAPAAGRG